MVETILLVTLLLGAIFLVKDSIRFNKVLDEVEEEIKKFKEETEE